jgi:hypothetical protein
MAPITKRTESWMEPTECVDTGLIIQTHRMCGHRADYTNPPPMSEIESFVKLISSHYIDRAIHGCKWNSELRYIDGQGECTEGRAEV